METGILDILIVAGIGVIGLLFYWLWDYIDFNDAFRGSRRDGRRGMSPDDAVKKMFSDADEPYDGK